MIVRISCSFLFVCFVSSAAPLWAQKPAPAKAHATIQCEGQPYVPVTVDEEQGIPLRLSDKAACSSRVTVLSDPQGYTVKVRTAEGKVDYVARYQIVVKTASNGIARSNAADVNVAAKPGQPQASAEQTAQQNGPRKPRVYVSDTASWNASGGFSRASSVAPGALYGAYDPEMADVYRDFTSDCSAIDVTQKKADADFVVLFDKDTPKKGFTGFHGLVKVNKVTVLSRRGGTLLSEAARSEDVAVSMACNAVSEPPANASSAGHQSSQ